MAVGYTLAKSGWDDIGVGFKLRLEHNDCKK